MTRHLERTVCRAVGTACTLSVSAAAIEIAVARFALAAGWTELLTCERVLSRFSADSDLSLLNRSAGHWVEVDERLLDALADAVRLRAETGGLFDPTVLPVLAAAGYDRSFELLTSRPPVRRVWAPGADIEIDRSGGRARVERDAAVDLGGIGKGYAAGRVLDAMQRAWPGLPGALVDLGGDIAVRGAPPDGTTWLIAVEDPRDTQRSLGLIALESGGVATSGPANRRFGPDGTLHHLIDPTLGVPAARGPLAVTVCAADPAQADAHATALAVSTDPAAYLAERPALGAVVVTPAGPDVYGAVDFVPRPASLEVSA